MWVLLVIIMIPFATIFELLKMTDPPRRGGRGRRRRRHW